MQVYYFNDNFTLLIYLFELQLTCQNVEIIHSNILFTPEICMENIICSGLDTRDTTVRKKKSWNLICIMFTKKFNCYKKYKIPHQPRSRV